MSTRGTLAVKIDGVVKGSYNHSDSYPTWLGNRVLEFIHDARPQLAEVREKARALTALTADQKPTAKDIRRLKKYTNLGVSEGNTQDWYCLLRGTQGNLASILDAGLYEPFTVGDEEWSYVVDLDEETLHIYHGSDHKAGIPFAEVPREFLADDLSWA